MKSTEHWNVQQVIFITETEYQRLLDAETVVSQFILVDRERTDDG